MGLLRRRSTTRAATSLPEPTDHPTPDRAAPTTHSHTPQPGPTTQSMPPRDPTTHALPARPQPTSPSTKGTAATVTVLVVAFLGVLVVWVLSAWASYSEQTRLSQHEGFAHPALLPWTLDGLAFALAFIALAAALDGRSAIAARIGVLLAISGSVWSNTAGVSVRAGDAGVTNDAFVLAAIAPISAMISFEIILSAIRRIVFRWRGQPPPVAIPALRPVRVVLSPIKSIKRWRDEVLTVTDYPNPLDTSALRTDNTPPSIPNRADMPSLPHPSISPDNPDRHRPTLTDPGDYPHPPQPSRTDYPVPPSTAPTDHATPAEPRRTDSPAHHGSSHPRQTPLTITPPAASAPTDKPSPPATLPSDYTHPPFTHPDIGDGPERLDRPPLPPPGPVEQAAGQAARAADDERRSTGPVDDRSTGPDPETTGRRFVDPAAVDRAYTAYEWALLEYNKRMTASELAPILGVNEDRARAIRRTKLDPRFKDEHPGEHLRLVAG